MLIPAALAYFAVSVDVIWYKLYVDIVYIVIVPDHVKNI